MILTEVEAKQRWCPYAFPATREPEERRGFFAGVRSLAINRYEAGEPIHACRCIGSKCMAWRWALVEIDFATKGPVTQGTPLGMVSYERSTTRGYCGLAGKP